MKTVESAMETKRDLELARSLAKGKLRQKAKEKTSTMNYKGETTA